MYVNITLVYGNTTKVKGKLDKPFFHKIRLKFSYLSSVLKAYRGDFKKMKTLIEKSNYIKFITRNS